VAVTAALTAGLLSLLALASCGCGHSSAEAPPPPSVPAFDGAAALSLIQAQCAFGPRTPGSKAHSDTLAWLQAQLQPLAGKVVVQSFSATTPLGGPYDFANVLAVCGPATGDALLLAAHWDSRPIADEDSDPANRTKPVPAADDGASGVAVLLELARMFHGQAPPRPVILAVLDAEDSGTPASQMAYEGFCIGTVYLAAHWPAEVTRPAQGVLLDMVGGDGKPVARIPVNPAIHRFPAFRLGREGTSLEANPVLVETIWSQAEALGHGAFIRDSAGYITDDHEPLIEAGIATVDIIHVFPVVWHTVDDTPEHCSADSLFQVGDTLAHAIYKAAGQ
jgi:Zn-dependent M28 family amino/carboxypeptidase